MNGRTQAESLDLEVVRSILVISPTVDGNLDEGLEVDDSGSIQVIGGTYTNNAEAGMDIDDTTRISVIGVHAIANGEHGLQIEAQEDEDELHTIKRVHVSFSVFSGNVGDGIQIVEEANTSVQSVIITHVLVANNTELAPGEGGHGLFIDISGELVLKGVRSIGNDHDDALP